MRRAATLAAAFVVGGWTTAAWAQEGGVAPAHFHHLHLNVTDPSANVAFYTMHFDCERGRFAGHDAVWAQKSWLLFNEVKAAPAWEPISAIWHFGWGAEDMKTTYQKQLDMGAKFFAPLTPLPQVSNEFYFAYVLGPDHALIELNTANHHNFGHVHLFSEDPIAAGEWYVKHLGATPRFPGRAPSREPRFINNLQVGPSHSLMMDNVNIIIFPLQYSKQDYKDHWKGQTEIASTRGRVVDHMAVSVDDLPKTLERLKKDGIKVTQEARTVPGTKIRSAFIEGPDKIAIEIVEGHARKE